MSVYHALEKEGVNVKVTAIPWKSSSMWSFKKKRRTCKQSSIRLGSLQCLLWQCFQACFEVFGSSIAMYVSLSPLRLCNFFLSSFFLSVLSVTIHKKKITLWQGFHPFHLSLSCRQVHSIVHVHESGPSLRNRCSFVQAAGGSCRSKQVTVCFQMSDYLWVPFCSVSAAQSTQGWLICWGGDVALRLVIRWVLLLIAYLLTLAV